MNKKFIPYIISLGGGAFYATGFPLINDHSFILGPLIAFLAFNWSLDQTTKWKDQLFICFLFSLGFYQTGYYWIPFLLKEFGGIYTPFNFLLGFAFSLILLPQTYCYLFFKRKYKNIFLLGFIYSLLEFFIPQQFPSHLGHTFISLTPKFNLGLAPIFGASIYSFIVCVMALAIISHIKTKKMSTLHYSICAILLLGSFLINFRNEHLKSNETINLRIVQPNIGNFIKVDSERGGMNSFKSVMDSYYELSTANISKPIDLIIWPETAFPTLMSSNILKQSGTNFTPPLIKQILNKTNSEILLGGYDFNIRSKSNYGFESDYNTAFYFSKNAELKDVYHKIKLIPFGEGLPFGPINQFLSQYITNVSFFAKGDTPTLFKLPNGHTFQTAICYEILFPEFIKDLLNGNEHDPDFLINLTNDSWYGDTSEPYQHLFLSKWRAIEFQIPIVRSTNTGITTIIYPNGLESIRLNINEKKYMDLEMNLVSHEKTFFQKFGILSFLFLGILLSFLERNLLLKVRVSE
jgi:apolipoprotein N-acyltransferase